MEQTRHDSTQNLAERMCWEVARRDDSRVARRLYRRYLVDGVYRLDEGALLDDFFHFLDQVGGDGGCCRRSMARPATARWSPSCRMSCSTG
jgi:hypothetical protein